jgi:uncharacterized membrane protein
MALSLAKGKAMKHSEIKKLQADGFITSEQCSQIIERYGLKEDGGRFLAIISTIGSVLVAAGIILLVSAHWDEIPRAVKIALGLLLMLGAHGGALWVGGEGRGYHKTEEALHLLGSGLFLANIALVGQIYNLSSHPPNAILIWLAGIVALPWILRSKAQHLLVLLGLGVWFAWETSDRTGVLYLGESGNQIPALALLGLSYLGFGYCLRASGFAEFSPATESIGLLAFQMFAYPLTLEFWRSAADHGSGLSGFVIPVMSLVALGLLALGTSRLRGLSRQWRWTWGLALAAAIALLAGYPYRERDWGCQWFATLALFVISLLQIHVGLDERSASYVNLGVAFVALHIISTYFRLVYTMGTTGLMFVVSGLFLIIFGVFLEKKRRTLMRAIKTNAP